LRKRVIVSIGILSVLLFVTTAYNPASATTYAVGVRVGDTADYDVSITPEPDFAKMHVLVYDISGTTVTLDVSYIFKNGSHSASIQYTGDIETGSGDALWMWYLIAKSLTTGDPILSGLLVKINDTGTMTVAGASRTVCHLNINWALVGNMWWDQETGILVKSNIAIIFFGWYNVTLTSTSLWSAGLFGLSWTTLLIIGSAAVVLIAVIAIVLRRRH